MILHIWQLAISDGTPKYAFYTACIVGQLLTLINQGEAMFSDGELSYWKAALTFLVPYVVAIVNAVLTKIRILAPVLK